jgi:hypothetical protein
MLVNTILILKIKIRKVQLNSIKPILKTETNKYFFKKTYDIHPTIDLTHHKAQYKPYHKPKHT